jgi:TetR/AcrR family transcriptional regulator, transcriptional repressor for nem operon
VTENRADFAISYNAHLRQQLCDGSGLRKGERTQAKLRIATIQLLDAVGYYGMRQTGICNLAGISPASFYGYYKDKRDITLSVVNSFVDYAYDRLFWAPETSKRSVFEAICFSNRRWIEVVRSNVGLMRCIFQLADSEPDFAARFEKVSHKLHVAVAESLLRRAGAPQADRPVALLMAYALGSMMDEVARRLIVHPRNGLTDLIETERLSDDALAEVLGVIWYRSIYGQDPEQLSHDFARRAAAWHLPSSTSALAHSQ